MADLKGRVVAFMETRRAAELADLIHRHHGRSLAAPCLRELHHPDAPELADAVDLLCDDGVSVAIFLTGGGANTLLEAARLRGREADLLAALARKRVAARGPKPVAVLRKAGVRIDLQAPAPHTSQELLAALADWDLAGRRVVVQLYGSPNEAFLDGLAARGAEVATVSPYDWDGPIDAAPVLRLIDALAAGQVDALLGTNAAQVDIFFAIVREHGREGDVRRALARIPVAAQGPVCAAAFERGGVAVTVMPPTGHMGALVLALARYFDSSQPAVRGSQLFAAQEVGSL